MQFKKKIQPLQPLYMIALLNVIRIISNSYKVKCQKFKVHISYYNITYQKINLILKYVFAIAGSKMESKCQCCHCENHSCISYIIPLLERIFTSYTLPPFFTFSGKLCPFLIVNNSRAPQDFEPITSLTSPFLWGVEVPFGSKAISYIVNYVLFITNFLLLKYY